MSRQSGQNNLNEAAILLLALAPEQASSIIGHMDDDDLIRLGRRMSEMENIDPERVDEAAEKYLHLHLADDPIIKAGPEQTRILLKNTVDENRAGKIIDGIETPPVLTIWDKLSKAEPDILASQISSEQPQTIALILCSINEAAASQILVQLPVDQQAAIVECISNIESIPDDLVRDIEQAMEDGLEKIAPDEGAVFDGISKTVDMLKKLNKKASKTVMDNLQKLNADLFAKVDKLLVTFDDLVDVSNKDMQTILKHISSDELVRSLKGATDAVRSRFLDNLSQRAADMMREDLEVMPPMTLVDVETSQREILKVIRKLDEDGTITINSSDLA